MKKLIFLLIFFINFNLISSFPYNTAKASTESYMRVLSEDVYIYSDNNLTNKLFKIPYSYYVKIENVSGNLARVSYGNDNEYHPVIMGYVDISNLTETDIVPSNPFSTIKVSSSYSDVLFNDNKLTKAYFNVPDSTFMIYYGDFIMESGKEICYVYCNNKLGYFDKSALNPFSVPLNKDPIKNDEIIDDGKEQNPQEENKKPSSLPAEGLQIIIIIGLSIICISIVYALFKPTKAKNDTAEYYQEE